MHFTTRIHYHCLVSTLTAKFSKKKKKSTFSLCSHNFPCVRIKSTKFPVFSLFSLCRGNPVNVFDACCNSRNLNSSFIDWNLQNVKFQTYDQDILEVRCQVCHVNALRCFTCPGGTHQVISSCQCTVMHGP